LIINCGFLSIISMLFKIGVTYLYPFFYNKLLKRGGGGGGGKNLHRGEGGGWGREGGFFYFQF